MCDIKHVDFYPSDWLQGTSELTLEERGLYWVACSLIYSRGGPVTRDHLRQVSGVDGRVFKRVLKRLLDLGKLVEQDGLISQQRCINELAKAQLRLSKWRKNLDNPAKPNGYDLRAGRKPPTTNHQLPIESPPPPTESPPPRARARPPEVRAAPAEEEGKDFKISEDWIREVDEERQAEGKPPLDLHELARQTMRRWRHDPPRNCYLAWKGRALKAKPNPSLEPIRRTSEEELRLIEEAKRQGLARLRAEQALEEAA